MATKKTSKTTTGLVGKELIRAAVNQILDHPETWYQGSWHSSCGTKHCIAGWCQLLSAGKADDDTASTDAKKALGISDFESDWLFDSLRTLPDIHRFAKDMISGEVDRDGFDRAGFDRDGFNRAGFDRDGKRLPRL